VIKLRVMAIVFAVVLSASLFTSLTPFMNPTYNVVGNVNHNGVRKDVIHIKTATQLAAIGGIDSEGKYYVLDNDINLSNGWVSIHDFRGTFDGQGHSINNLHVIEGSNGYIAGLFGVIANRVVTIKNVRVNISPIGFNNLGFDEVGGL